MVRIAAVILGFFVSLSPGLAQDRLPEDAVPERTIWTAGAPLLVQGEQGAFDETAVKDPSIVRHGGKWHLFFTARGNGEYTIGYVSAPSLADLRAAPRVRLRQLRGRKDAYAAAPQVFLFEPRRTWYLVYQTRDSNYQPVYSTTATIDRPRSWSRPTALLEKDEKEKWIDFWVICDETTAYLFYTRSHRDVFLRTTSLADFPRGWKTAGKVFSGVHEAVHVYRVKGRDEYHMIYELNRNGRRSFGLAVADHPGGPWKKITDRYAAGGQLRFGPDVKESWTNEVSHGEAIRSGYDQRLEYDGRNAQWLIQGLPEAEHRGPYPSLPWRLGVIKSRG
jgi:hypothetical protein